MLAIKIQFLSGTYHATPWGKNVNEGIPEWPPSIWRFLRAIISVWKQSHSSLTDTTVWPILQKINSTFPDYYLPDATVSSTQHYLPIKHDKTTLVVNTFVIVGQSPVYIIWNNIDLTEEETKVLDKILASMNYFGRAESWCSISIVKHNIPTPNCCPVSDNVDNTKHEIVNVLFPKKDISFVDLSKTNTSSISNLDSITVTTTQLHDKNYTDPPGGQWISYARSSTCFAEKTSAKIDKTSKNFSWIRYTIVGSVRPSIQHTLKIGDIARTACMSIYGRRNHGRVSETLSGKDIDGKPLRGHKHAFYLPTYELQNRSLDHITIFTKNKFTDAEIDALFHLNRLYRYNVCDVNLIFQECGTLSDLPNIPILKMSKVWRSSTPLFLARHIKYRGQGSNKHVVDGPEEQISRELHNRYMLKHKIKTIDVGYTQKYIQDTNAKPFDFYASRSHGSLGSTKPYTVRLEFTEPVQGPITLGYGSHFGLGMFLPEDVDQ